jgi:hypothetical protein
VWRIAARQLARIRRGRRETVSLEALEGGLRAGLDPQKLALLRD